MNKNNVVCKEPRKQTFQYVPKVANEDPLSKPVVENNAEDAVCAEVNANVVDKGKRVMVEDIDTLKDDININDIDHNTDKVVLLVVEEIHARYDFIGVQQNMQYASSPNPLLGFINDQNDKKVNSNDIQTNDNCIYLSQDESSSIHEDCRKMLGFLMTPYLIVHCMSLMSPNFFSKR